MSRQRFGQHFLASPRIGERIASAACGEHIPTVVEIGPGRGALTAHLLPRVDRLIAVEIDPDLAAHLRAEYAAEPKFTVIEADALETDFAAFSPHAICGNLPYYIATPLLTRIARIGIPTVALIQKEVAQRLVAQPGTREYGYLTCQIALFADVEYLFTVKPGAFRPPPKVESAVVRLRPHPRGGELGVEADAFLHFLSTCFHLKRKTLRNNLAGLYPREILASVPAHLPDTTLRAEQCPLTALAALFLYLAEQCLERPGSTAPVPPAEAES